jgi:glycosyltransferase involved in cell wall biosynthesis
MITVLVPLYNGIEYLEECLLSVKAQVYTNWTCLVGVNGHGADGGAVFAQASSIVAALADPRFSVINLPVVKGVSQAKNAMVEMCQTTWVAHLDADDKWHPMKLHCQVQSLAGADADIVGTFCRYFGDWKGEPTLPPGYVPPEIFHQMNPIINSSVLIRKELASYTDEFYGLEDYDCWIRNLLAKKIFYNVPLELTYHRLYSQSAFNASGRQEPERVRQKYFGHA